MTGADIPPGSPCADEAGQEWPAGLVIGHCALVTSGACVTTVASGQLPGAGEGVRGPGPADSTGSGPPAVLKSPLCLQHVTLEKVPPPLPQFPVGALWEPQRLPLASPWGGRTAGLKRLTRAPAAAVPCSGPRDTPAAAPGPWCGLQPGWLHLAAHFLRQNVPDSSGEVFPQRSSQSAPCEARRVPRTLPGHEEP